MLKTMQMRNNPGIIRIFTVFTIVLIVTYLVSPKMVIGSVMEKVREVSTFYQFKDEMCFCLMFFIGFQISKHTHVSKNTFFIIAIFLTALSAINYTYTVIQLTNLTGREDNTVNTAYNFISLFPIYAMAFKHHKKGVIILTAISIFYVMLSAKRGAIVCLFASILYALYWYNKNLSVSGFKKIIAIFSVCVLFMLAFYWYTQNDYLLDRISYMESNGIGFRKIGYSMMFNYWIEDSNILIQLFGNGTAQTVNVCGNYGHNDWLELLIDNGAFGVVIYAAVFVHAFGFIMKKVSDPILKLAIFLSIMIWFLKTCFSMGYTDLFSGVITFILGFCIRKSMLYDKTHQFYTSAVTYDSGRLRLR